MPADPARIATARAMLAQLGVTVTDLQRDEMPPVPTMTEYLPCVMAAAGPAHDAHMAPRPATSKLCNTR